MVVLICQFLFLCIDAAKMQLFSIGNNFLKKIIEFLTGENLHFDLADSDFGYIEFFKLIDTIPFKFGRQKLLRLSRSLGDYSHIYIVWNPKTKQIASYDMEHEELIDLASFDDFIENMTKYMNRIFE